MPGAPEDAYYAYEDYPGPNVKTDDELLAAPVVATPAVVLVVLCTFTLLGSAGWVAARQLSSCYSSSGCYEIRPVGFFNPGVPVGA